jgi:hypothetical protein
MEAKESTYFEPMLDEHGRAASPTVDQPGDVRLPSLPVLPGRNRSSGCGTADHAEPALIAREHVAEQPVDRRRDGVADDVCEGLVLACHDGGRAFGLGRRCRRDGGSGVGVAQ